MNWLRDNELDIPVIVISGEHIDEGEFGEKTVDSETGMAAAATRAPSASSTNPSAARC